MVTLKDAAAFNPNFTLPKMRLVLVSVRPAMPAPLRVTC